MMDPMWMFMFLFQSSLARLLLLKLLAPLNCWSSSSLGRLFRRLMELKQITLKSWTQFLIENLPWSPLQGGHTPSLPHHLLPEVQCLVPASHLPLYKTTSCTLSRPACNTFFLIKNRLELKNEC